MITIHHAALDEIEGRDIILRGVIDNDSVGELLTDDYQREAMPQTALGSILRALRDGDTLPDIILGMRGQGFTEPAPGTFELADPVYIVDGLQRTTGVRYHLKDGRGPRPRLGCVLHFGTDKAWERNQFRILNLLRTSVSPSVLLRNMREESVAILTLYGICHDPATPINGRVCWQQNMLKGHLISATTMAHAASQLHAHCVGLGGHSIIEMTPVLGRLVVRITLPTFRANLLTFFDLIDRAWGIRDITYKNGATHMRRGFLEMFARFLSDHLDFWEGDQYQLKIPYQLRNKISTFPVKDPEVSRLSGSSGKALQILYQLLVDHVNSGKRTQRLRHRAARPVNPFAEEIDEDAA